MTASSMTASYIKCHLRWKRLIFLLCLGMSTIFFWMTTTWSTKTVLPPCRPFHALCRAFLSASDNQTEWRRRDCQIKSYLTNNTLQCSKLMKDLHFITRPLSAEEEAYPLAFILTVHKELEVLIRLLRAIYTPQNIYCVHVDAKSPPEYKASVQKLVSCFENVFLSSRSETAIYAGFSRLKADLNCMSDLVTSKVSWRKVVNLCGQDFPLMSNLELSPKARDLLEWSRDTYSPDEHYWVTLNHLTEAPGSNIAGGWEGSIRAIKWKDQTGKQHNGCNGRYVRSICVYGLKDLPWLIKKESMFANKFENDFEPEALDCLEQWHRNKLLSHTSVPIEPSWLLATRSNSEHAIA
ncbi:N-acetyllactosaminide beta-1,6-N-acetylglucosaminyl-transferase isoform X2 [Corythoichthys intestinalis]|uniref:N-acetyllactosaminide beta-1,6-N-acetylglucosaminyl-transferase isoform X2 n=1 Tax=Corythoichthys intestinalis TaxID=161448 RepID=UPI0025A635CC|nr:N-acetyllactosaminide beta-1,6-N-acetylglucosaminyl-transferase isoform X2 [Corythoichthys intestinalis]